MQTRTEQAYEALLEEIRGERRVICGTVWTPPRQWHQTQHLKPRLRGWLVGASWACLTVSLAVVWGAVTPGRTHHFGLTVLALAISAAGLCGKAAFDAGEEAAVVAALLAITATHITMAEETLAFVAQHDVYWLLAALMTIVQIGGPGPIWRRIKGLIPRAGGRDTPQLSSTLSGLFPAE